MSRRIDVIGGGPGGLYVARLLKLRNPALQVTVHERMGGATETFGFGVGLTESTMTNLEQADPASAERVRAVSHYGHDLQLQGRDRDVTLHGARNLAIGRATLLEVLAEAALDAGVEIRRGDNADVSTTDADVVIAADGVRSAAREKYATELGVSTSLGRTRFVWCGADFAFDTAFFTAVERGDAMYVAHAYPYAEDRSTMLIEVDDRTWDAAGLGEYDRNTPPGETDGASIRVLQDAFAEQLHGRPLLTNRTRWSRFTEIGLDRWWVDNVVLLGDAAHTAHYTLGSGTKLALEDAIALADALAGEASVAAAFEAYEAARHPSVHRFKQLARRSQAWWDSFRSRAARPTDWLALSYMTRSGNLTLAHYAADQPEAVRRALSGLGDDVPNEPAALVDWVLTRPGRVRTAAEAADIRRFAWTNVDVWDETADAAVAELTAGPSRPLLITGPPTAAHLPARIDLAERLRLHGARSVGVELPGTERALAATAIAAGRADFIVSS